MDCSLPGSSVHGIFQARVLEWVAIAFSEVPCRKNLKRDTKELSFNPKRDSEFKHNEKKRKLKKKKKKKGRG